MKFTFARSGGFAGAATAIQGEVTFDEDGGRVTSSHGYARDLTPAETAQIRSMIAQLRQQEAKGPDSARDQFQYDLEIVWSDSSSEHVALAEDTKGESAGMLAWVRGECDRIWNHRIQQ